MDNLNKEAITLMLKMVGTNCNMQCHYCYELHNSNDLNVKSYLSEETIKSFLQSISYMNYISVIFHGGEPLLASKKAVKNVIEILEENFPNKYEIHFQTNGTLIDDEWITIFSNLKCKTIVSISLDPIGEKDLRKSRTFDYRTAVYTSIQKLQKVKVNIGIVSVAHKYNINYFNDFIEELAQYGIKFLTINKYREMNSNDDAFITEKEYNDALILIAKHWISKRLFYKIQIQPLMSLMSNTKNKLCLYLADNHKCSNFVTLYSDRIMFCDHLSSDIPKLDIKCEECDIYEWCGSGCLVEPKDETFCSSRRSLKEFIRVIKNENTKSD